MWIQIPMQILIHLLMDGVEGEAPHLEIRKTSGSGIKTVQVRQSTKQLKCSENRLAMNTVN